MTPEEIALAALLRGDETRWVSAGDRANQRFLDAVATHGLQPLVARQIRRGVLQNVPAPVAQSLARAAVQHAAIESQFAAEVRRIADALGAAGLPALLLKGAALAYTHYPHPCLRPRTDTDLLIRDADRAAVFSLFGDRGYRPLNMTAGDLVLHQRTFVRTDRLGVRHVFDVHWKIAGPQVVADALPWDELERHAVRIPSLGEHARAPGDGHALLLACLHRMAHHYDNERLIWLYDIHLLASGLGEETLRAVMRDGAAKGLAGMCVRSLALARERFGTTLRGWTPDDGDLRTDASEELFHTDVRPVDILAADLKALPTWRQRLRLVREHLVPPTAFIRGRYGVHSPFALPALYAHRALTGAWKWLRPARRSDPFA